jgi:uncharacterized glyoxalase superfamily protein PhnB
MLKRSAAYLPVPDVAAIGAHYQNVYGFRCEYSAGEPPEFAVYSRDGLPIMFRRVADPSVISPNEKQGGTWDVFYWVDDVDALFAQLVRTGAAVAYPPVTQPYGVKEFAVRDPVGYVLGFGQALNE